MNHAAGGDALVAAAMGYRAKLPAMLFDACITDLGMPRRLGAG